MARRAVQKIVRQKSARKGAVDRRARAAFTRLADHVAEIPRVHGCGLHHASGRVQQAVGHIDQVEEARIEQGAGRLHVVAPADEARMADLACTAQPLQPLADAVGPQEIFGPAPLIAWRLAGGGLKARADIDLQHVERVNPQAP
jgi:hypothetical protein